MAYPLLTLRARIGRAALLISAVLATTTGVAAQDDSPYDPTLDCRALTYTGLNPRQIGLPAALAAAEQRRLSLDNLGYTLTWADREPDPAYIPALKRLVEQYRCFSGDAGLAMNAIEAAGEPSAYFLAYAQNWRRDDRIASSAFNALGIRGDSTVWDALSAVVAEAPSFARFGFRMQDAFRDYHGGVLTWSEFERWPVRRQIDEGAYTVVHARGYVVVPGVAGDSLALVENERDSFLNVIPRRILRRMAQAYPSAVAAAITAYEDTLRTTYLAARTPEHRALYLAVAAPLAREAAFPSNGPPLPPEVRDPVLAPSVCVEGPAGGPAFGPDGLTAVFSYTSGERDAVRVPYDRGNELTGSASGVEGAAPPEVFFPDDERDAPGRPFRVAFRPGEDVTWTLLGQTATATETTPRCGAPAAPLCNGLPATVWVSSAGLVVGGPLDGQPYAGRLLGTAGPDVIAGTDAADVIEGLDGDDLLCGGTGDDALDGGDGGDTADGGAGTDGCEDAETATACEGPIPVLTDVRPFGECLATRADGSYTAYFGYENLSGRAGRVPYGRGNKVTYLPPGSVVDEEVRGVSPELYAAPGVVPGHPGQTPPFPGFAFSFDVEAVDTGIATCTPDGACTPVTNVGNVSWTLLGETVTAAPGRLPECPTP